MTEANHNDSFEQTIEYPKQPDDEFIPDDALPLCPNCLRPCSPLQNYCDRCDSSEVINPLASYMPFVRIRFVCGFYGRIWRRIWYDQEAPIIHRLFYLLLIILFVPIFLIIALPLFLIGKIQDPWLRKATTAAFWAIAAVLLLFFLYFAFSM